MSQARRCSSAQSFSCEMCLSSRSRLRLLPMFLSRLIFCSYLGHDERWDERSKKRLAFLIEHSAEHITVGQKAWRDSFIQRNRYLVDHADWLLAVYDNNKSIRSGTGSTVHYAEKKGKNIVFIHPDTMDTTKTKLHYLSIIILSKNQCVEIMIGV